MSFNALDGLYKVCWETKSARFNAARRLQRRALAANLVIAVVSAFFIFISVIQIDVKYSLLVKLLGISGALVILIVSLWELARNSSVRSDRLHSCGVDLNELYQDVCQARAGSSDSDNLGALNKRYSEILRRCPENHEPIDFDLHRSRHDADYSFGCWNKFKTGLFWHLGYLDIVIYVVIFIIVITKFGLMLAN